VNAAQWAALYAGLPTFLAALAGLITAIRAKSTAATASNQAAVTSKALTDHLNKVNYPIQAEVEAHPFTLPEKS
jgi:hypothetical protein